ncbi:hypothetical protein [Nonomuraea africana]|uniref:hypothetical protein n=1 Tax=Nonomuraea africana TaxID=46171 RepID=UPI0033C10AD8
MTETVYRKQLRPVLPEGAEAMNRIFLVFPFLVAFVGDLKANDVPSMIAIVGVGLGCLLTAIVVAINDRWPN